MKGKRNWLSAAGVVVGIAEIILPFISDYINGKEMDALIDEKVNAKFKELKSEEDPK